MKTITVHGSFSFEMALDIARANKADFFMWRGERYNTVRKDEIETDMQSYWDFMRDGLNPQQRAAKAAAMHAEEQAHERGLTCL